MTADELLFFCLISELMARDIQQNYKTVSGSPPSTGINPRILTAPHCEVQQPPKRWLRLWVGKRWVTKHLIFSVTTWAPCAAPHMPPAPPPTPPAGTSQPHRIPITIGEWSFTNFYSHQVFLQQDWEDDWPLVTNSTGLTLLPVLPRGHWSSCWGAANPALTGLHWVAAHYLQLDATVLVIFQSTITQRAGQNHPMKPSHPYNVPYKLLSMGTFKQKSDTRKTGKLPRPPPGVGESWTWSTRATGAMLRNASLLLSPSK